MIRVKNLSKELYRGDEGQYALKGIKFDIGDNDFITIMGPSGGGKSTLFQVLGLLTEPSKDEYSVLKADEEIKLTKKEFKILALLMSNMEKVYTSEVIYNKVWNEVYLENDNSVITHIRNLREKLGDTVKDSMYIKTIWGIGYKVEKDS